MVPTFLVLAAPLARARRVPLLLWYTHWHGGRMLRLATVALHCGLERGHRELPLRLAESPRDRPCDRRDDLRRTTARPGRGPAAAARLRAHRSLEGPQHAARGICAGTRPGSRRGARDPWPIADRRRTRASGRAGAGDRERRPAARPRGGRAGRSAQRGAGSDRRGRRRREPGRAARRAPRSTRPSTRPRRAPAPS